MMPQLQEKKSAMVDATLSPDDSVCVSMNQHGWTLICLLQAMGRLTPEDVSLYATSGSLSNFAASYTLAFFLVPSKCLHPLWLYIA